MGAVLSSLPSLLTIVLSVFVVVYVCVVFAGLLSLLANDDDLEELVTARAPLSTSREYLHMVEEDCGDHKEDLTHRSASERSAPLSPLRLDVDRGLTPD